MSLDLWSLILSIPIAIIANIFTPKVQNWLNSRNNKKSLENEQHEELNTLKEENKKDSYEEFELVRARVVNIGIICIPFIIVIIGALLGLINSTVFILLFILSFTPSINLIIRLIKRFMYVTKYKRERNVQKEIEQIKSIFLTIVIFYLPVILLDISPETNSDSNTIHTLLFFLSFSISLYYIIHSIIQYVQLMNNKELKKQFPISLGFINIEASFLKRNRDNIIVSTIFLLLSIVIAYLLE